MSDLTDTICPRCGSAVLAGRLYCTNWLGCEWKRDALVAADPCPFPRLSLLPWRKRR